MIGRRGRAAAEESPLGREKGVQGFPRAASHRKCTPDCRFRDTAPRRSADRVDTLLSLSRIPRMIPGRPPAGKLRFLAVPGALLAAVLFLLAPPPPQAPPAGTTQGA